MADSLVPSHFQAFLRTAILSQLRDALLVASDRWVTVERKHLLSSTQKPL
jgi:hypothetical protein